MTMPVNFNGQHSSPNCIKKAQNSILQFCQMPSVEFYWGYNVYTGNKETKHVLLLEFSRFSNLNHHYKQMQECIKKCLDALQHLSKIAELKPKTRNLIEALIKYRCRKRKGNYRYQSEFRKEVINKLFYALLKNVALIGRRRH